MPENKEQKATSWPGSRRSWPIQEDEEETHAETTGERPWR